MFKKLRSSTIKIIKTEHHISNLETYIDQGIIPKGLVLKASPLTTGEKSNRFFHRWNNILYHSSFSLMDLLRQEAIHQVNYLYKLRDNLHCRSREQLSDPELDEIQIKEIFKESSNYEDTRQVNFAKTIYEDLNNTRSNNTTTVLTQTYGHDETRSPVYEDINESEKQKDI
ncbi:unnamed protein product [Mytilus edulis]|uniref:Uncharacterized protein n=1 Tax=Mytilus edulis TaxID=6550 RepID=A0A8S3RS50_MYTED|nr:unnamed protein product [Mytilus edulis]